MRFIRDAVITVVVLALVVGVLAYSRIRAGGLSADAEPGAIERSVATRLLRLSISPDAERATNPFAGDPDTWRAAVDHFNDHCAICHGADGRGRTELGENMYPKVPDLADSTVQRLSDGALFSIIQNGVRWTGMPAWKREHTPEDSWKLVSLVRRVPSLTAEDLELLTHGSEQRSESSHNHQPAEEHKHAVPHHSRP
jgi:mono/diheme cytochrome c family protein